MKYFYIVGRDKQIVEVSYTEEAYKDTVEQMMRKGLIAIKPKGAVSPIIINSVDISKVLPEEQYLDWCHSSSPREYVHDGIWRDGKERKPLRYEKWKREQMENEKVLSKPQINCQQMKIELEQFRTDEEKRNIKEMWLKSIGAVDEHGAIKDIQLYEQKCEEYECYLETCG
jgi:hypothetical protein